MALDQRADEVTAVEVLPAAAVIVLDRRDACPVRRGLVTEERQAAGNPVLLQSLAG